MGVLCYPDFFVILLQKNMNRIIHWDPLCKYRLIKSDDSTIDFKVVFGSSPYFLFEDGTIKPLEGGLGSYKQIICLGEQSHNNVLP